MPEEVAALVRALSNRAEPIEVGRREFHRGRLADHPVVLAQSRVGKVAAATTATSMIAALGVEAIVFTGLAGGVDPSLRIGDIVVADRLCQHDLDASPIFPAMEIPLLGLAEVPTDAGLTDAAERAARQFAESGVGEHMPGDVLEELGIREPRVVRGLIASGDRFVSSHAEVERLRERVPEALCVEMEGAAVAQVCYEHGVPCAVVRTISDTADDDAADHFMRALGTLAAGTSLGIVERLMPMLA